MLEIHALLIRKSNKTLIKRTIPIDICKHGKILCKFTTNTETITVVGYDGKGRGWQPNIQSHHKLRP